jgi:hypothetical protein
VIIFAILALVQSAPLSEDMGRAFPADHLVCTVNASPASFALDIKRRAGGPNVLVTSARDDVFPSGEYLIGSSFITRRVDGRAADYRVGFSSIRKAGQFSLNMQVIDGRPEKIWLRLMPEGPYRSDRFQEIGSAACAAKDL